MGGCNCKNGINQVTLNKEVDIDKLQDRSAILTSSKQDRKQLKLRTLKNEKSLFEVKRVGEKYLKNLGNFNFDNTGENTSKFFPSAKNSTTSFSNNNIKTEDYASSHKKIKEDEPIYIENVVPYEEEEKIRNALFKHFMFKEIDHETM